MTILLSLLVKSHMYDILLLVYQDAATQEFLFQFHRKDLIFLIRLLTDYCFHSLYSNALFTRRCNANYLPIGTCFTPFLFLNTILSGIHDYPIETIFYFQNLMLIDSIYRNIVILLINFKTYVISVSVYTSHCCSTTTHKRIHYCISFICSE